MAVKPLIVGEAPNRSGSSPPISGAVGRRLTAMCGMDDFAFARAFHRTNVLDWWPGEFGVGSAFPMFDAVPAARTIERRFVGNRIVVLLGKRVGRAFGLRVDYFERARVRASDVFVVPHPSGVNRWYNDPRNVARMRSFMRGLTR